MDLILWRHAEAVPERPDLPDLERPLTAKGERQAQRMADWLNRRLPESTRILVSPALRCQQTAQALGRKFRTVEQIRPDVSAEQVLAAARWPDGVEPVLVVGHQPTLGMACATVLTGSAAPWTLKKGALWWFRQRDREGEGEVLVQAVQAPDGL
jgi:phosphohistidine phosphatase